MTQPLPERALPRMLALTLWPEWAWAITHLDKRVENRSPAFAAQIARRVGDGWLAIHAGAHIGGRRGPTAEQDGLFALITMARDAGWSINRTTYTRFSVKFYGVGVPDRIKTVEFRPAEIQRSAIVALARVGEVLPWGAHRPWKVGYQAAVVLHHVHVLPEPIACSGKQGLWVPADAVQAQLRAAIGRIGGER